MAKQDVHLDTNVIVRFVVGDGDAGMAAAATRLFHDAGSGGLRLLVAPLVFGECVFVLETRYEASRPLIREAMLAVVDSPGVRCGERALLERTLDLWVREEDLHFVDAYLLVQAREGNVRVATFDRRMREVAGADAMDPLQR